MGIQMLDIWISDTFNYWKTKVLDIKWQVDKWYQPTIQKPDNFVRFSNGLNKMADH